MVLLSAWYLSENSRCPYQTFYKRPGASYKLAFYKGRTFKTYREMVDACVREPLLAFPNIESRGNAEVSGSTKNFKTHRHLAPHLATNTIVAQHGRRSDRAGSIATSVQV